VAAYREFWITNAIAVRATPAVVRSLGTMPSVSTIELDRWRRWIDEDPAESALYPLALEPATRPPTGAADAAHSVEWNVSRIRADEVWHALSISGTGAVVAGMDTGVDWIHPALKWNYRGFNPHGPSNHTHSWHDATDLGALYPVDGHGHGTHTMGTAVGRGGIGVAPGALWIGVRVFSSQGYGYDSWVHAGFEWLLAPGGDPAKAPDVVNCSWSNTNGALTTFQDDLRALRAAGILAVFANGNEGPGIGTVGSPASLPEALAVGAVDEYDEVANFSARGPSPWGDTRPLVAAPGVHIRSSQPGAAYASEMGTSMATPHVSGVAALLRGVSPTLSITRTVQLITSTVVPLGTTIPNNDTGWGRVDGFAAVSALAQSGFVTGIVRTVSEPGFHDLGLIEGAAVTAKPWHGNGAGIQVIAPDGRYRLALSPGIYDVTASAFGHESATVAGVQVVAGATEVVDLTLTPKPVGRLVVQVSDGSGQVPLTATVSVLDTPYVLLTHTHSFSLPAHTYSVEAKRLGYRVVTATAAVSVGKTSVVSLTLPPAPSILLVDSGGWYYESQAVYFRQALDGLAYAYEEWPIRHLPDDSPVASDLAPYDIVVWTAPRDAPGYIGAGEALAAYLRGSGRLLLTGQDVGLWDGGGYWSPPYEYYTDYLKAQFDSDSAPTRVLYGMKGDIYAGLTITIAGPGGADNQDYPDVVSVADPDGAAPVLMYNDSGCGGLRAGTCLDYRAVYLPFGFEGISDASQRRTLMDRTLDWLAAAPPGVGLEIQPASQLGIGPPGSVVTHAVRVRHIGRPDTEQVALTITGTTWPTELSTSTLMLSPCTSATVAISVTIPPTVPWDSRDLAILSVHSSLSPTLSVTAALATKAPAPILLVDDDRWYDQRATYEEVMANAQLPYDVWQPPLAGGNGHVLGPPLEVLKHYPTVVWWTGYDWYAPITSDELGALEAYLDGGGSLFLSSQDYLYYHDDLFNRRYLGILSYTQDITPTEVVGVSEDLIGDGLGVCPLHYPWGYQNWSDGVLPAPGASVVFRDQNNQAVALAHRDGGHSAVFFGFPFEALGPDRRAPLMERAVGWLSWLGRSTLSVDPRSAGPGDVVTYTIALRNDDSSLVTASMSNTLPAAVVLDENSLVGPGTYEEQARRVSWRGSIQPGEAVTLAYRVTIQAGTLPGDSIANSSRITLEDQQVAFDRAAVLDIGAPDLSRSSLGCDPAIARPGDAVSCTLALVNSGPETADPATASIHPPGYYAPGSKRLLEIDDGLQTASETITWSGAIPGGSQATLVFDLHPASAHVARTLYGVAFIDDGQYRKYERPVWVEIVPCRVYAPLLLGGEDP
jgi:uncharacterized repeat protein (TIGR01451 family)